jgi:hypothetical protein
VFRGDRKGRSVTAIACATFKVRPQLEPEGPTAWIAVAHHQVGGETWATVGAAATEREALADLNDQLPPGVEACLSVPDKAPEHQRLRHRLLWSAKSRAFQLGTPIVQVR